MDYFPTEPDVIDCEECCSRGWVGLYLDTELTLEKCEDCHGEGFIEPNLEEEYLNHMEQKYERRKDERNE